MTKQSGDRIPGFWGLGLRYTQGQQTRVPGRVLAAVFKHLNRVTYENYTFPVVAHKQILLNTNFQNLE